jgi:hypothetical protein
MTAPANVLLEELTRITPFGLGLWDVVTGRLVSDGLAVRIFRLVEGRALDAVNAYPNRSGIFVAQNFPSLRAFEASSGNNWAIASPAPVFLAEVRDATGRFTPFVMHVALPTRGLVFPECTSDVLSEPIPPSPPMGPAYTPLFSTPSRPVPAGRAAVRATLYVAGANKPAPFAVLEVRDPESGRRLARGVANEGGEVVAMFPYPEPSSPPASSPPASPPVGVIAAPRPLTDQAWPLEIAVRYARNVRLYDTDRAKPPLADLCDVMRQPLATVTAATSPPVTLSEATLRYGEDLILGADVGANKLFISPA